MAPGVPERAMRYPVVKGLLTAALAFLANVTGILAGPVPVFWSVEKQ